MSLWRRSLDLILPPSCMQCRAPVSDHHAVCGTCWAQLRFISAPFCQQCGLPFPFDYGAETLCGDCLASPPLFHRARAALVYDDASRSLILALKHGDRTQSARTLAKWMGTYMEAGAPVDIVAPVPLHWLRLFKRRYNQSALLAEHIARNHQLQYQPDLLERVRYTPSQAGLNRGERADNVKNAFRVKKSHTEQVKHKNILLVDDVLTTGATLHACSKTLHKAGAANITILTLARVV